MRIHIHTISLTVTDWEGAVLIGGAISHFNYTWCAAAARHHLAFNYTVGRRLTQYWAAASSGHVSCSGPSKDGFTRQDCAVIPVQK